MQRSDRPARLRRHGAAWALLAATTLALAGFAASSPPARAQASSTVPTDAELASRKAYWQKRYRGLLESADTLREVIAREEELYADANRRNYRRGNKRHVHREAMLEARAQLAEVEAELAVIQEEARRVGALPGWFYEVEWQREEGASPAAADDGRNPLYDDLDEAP